MHVHMFTGRKVVEECGEPAPAFYADEFIRIFEHPEPCQEVHCVICPAEPSKMSDDKYRERYFANVLRGIEPIDGRFGVAARGYSVVYQGEGENDGASGVHVVAGRRVGGGGGGGELTKTAEAPRPGLSRTPPPGAAGGAGVGEGQA